MYLVDVGPDELVFKNPQVADGVMVMKEEDWAFVDKLCDTYGLEVENVSGDNRRGSVVVNIKGCLTEEEAESILEKHGR